jgi:hypothetical protein
MKTKTNQMMLVILFAILYSNLLQAYEIKIEKGPAIDAGPDTFIPNYSPQDGDSLVSWLGGAEGIQKILIGTPTINSNQVDFNEEYVRGRFDNSVCVNSQIKEWHYAPFTRGTIYFTDGRKINFTMYLSGIALIENLFD